MLKTAIRAGMLGLCLSGGVVAPVAAQATAEAAPANPLWREAKVRNYLPHMTWPEVADLLTRTDVVIIPVAAIEEHGPQGPVGTDFLNGLEAAKLVAQKTDALVAPILLPGNSPYHMAFPGTISLKAETIQAVYFEAAQSLIHHGFRRFIFLNAHGGNAATTRFIVDRINQETPAIAVEMTEAAAPYMKPQPTPGLPPGQFDRHAGFGETSNSLYLTPGLVDMKAVKVAPITLPPHLKAMMPKVAAGDRTASLLFLAEALKAEDTGKRTSTREMTETGIWSQADVAGANAAAGKLSSEALVEATVKFIEDWKRLRPLQPLAERSPSAAAAAKVK